jgi:hypothetical protein
MAADVILMNICAKTKTLGILMNFSAKTPPHRQAENR